VWRHATWRAPEEEEEEKKEEVVKVGRFQSPYIRSDSVKASGPVTATISSVEVETVGQGEEAQQKLVAYFDELEQGFVLNKSNLGTLIEISGSDDTDNWLGTVVEIYHDPNIHFAGKRVGGLRLRAGEKKE
jgi:hypothetical protein